MTVIAEWAERTAPIEADDGVEAARRRFLDDPSLSVLAVVDGGRPVGLAIRTIVLAAAGAVPPDEPVTILMAHAPVLAGDTPAAQALELILAEGIGEGMIVAEDGRYSGVVTRDSLLRALQGRLERDSARSEDRRRFIEMLSREIRTPMTGVLAVAELLQRQPLTSDAQAFVQTIIDSSDSLVRLVDDALDLAMGETGRLEPRPEDIRLQGLMDDLQAEWQARKSANVAVLVSYDGDPDLGVVVDGGRLKQVFDNLIRAALRNTRQGAVEASLKARAGPEGVYLEGRVRDAGQGLPPDQLARIFEPATHEEWTRAGWTGLGPPLSRLIVEAMRGAIRAESNAGEGVTVCFEMMTPRVEIEDAAPEEAARLARGAIHVLVVDDNATNRMVAEGLCELFDCTSECAEDGVEAVEAAKTGRFDLILMDIKMPRMDGMEATRAIRSLPGRAGQAPIIALTANADPEDAKAYLACGMCSVVEKPIKPERLLMAMNAALEGAASEPGAVQAA